MTIIPPGIHGTVAAVAVPFRASFTQSAQATSWALGNVNYSAGVTGAYLGVVSEGSPGDTWTATLGGVAMTELAAARIGIINTVSLFYILSATLPAGGSNRAIVLTAQNSISGYARFWAFPGVAQSAPLATVGEGTGGFLTVTRTGVLINSLLLAVGAINNTANQTNVTLTSSAGTWGDQFSNSGAAGLHWGIFGDRLTTAAGSFDAIFTNVGGASSGRRLSGSIVEIQ